MLQPLAELVGPAALYWILDRNLRESPEVRRSPLTTCLFALATVPVVANMASAMEPTAAKSDYSPVRLDRGLLCVSPGLNRVDVLVPVPVLVPVLALAGPIHTHS